MCGSYSHAEAVRVEDAGELTLDGMREGGRSRGFPADESSRQRYARLAASRNGRDLAAFILVRRPSDEVISQGDG